MTIKELLQELRKYDPDLPVFSSVMYEAGLIEPKVCYIDKPVAGCDLYGSRKPLPLPAIIIEGDA